MCACWNFPSNKSHLLSASFHSLPLLGTQHTGKAKFRGTHSLPGTLDCLRRHRLFHYTWQLYELTSLWCFSPAVCFSREGGTQIILNETNNISVAVSAIKQTVPQYAVGRLKTRCSLNSMKVVHVSREKNLVKVFLQKIKEEQEHCISWVKFLETDPSTGLAKGHLRYTSEMLLEAPGFQVCLMFMASQYV